MMTERRYYLTWLIVITLLGCALRIYRLNDIPYTYDELSALSRTHYHTFNKLIQRGIVPDGHPAGVQIFLYAWVRVFGYAEWVVKLPFIIMGIACIPLIYLLGKKWFSPDAAIIAAGLVACLQYTVMYSQIARPYIPGLFFVLLLAVIWNGVMVKATTRNLFAYAVMLALCAYTHYFSLLTAACMVITGFFVIDRRHLFKYCLAALGAVLLFAPHGPLFFEQLKNRGLDWLSVPGPSFFGNYVFYVFNFSILIIAALVLLMVQGAYLSAKSKMPQPHKLRVIALLWFVVPAGVGYFYSVYRAPVLQNSVLLFGFPFMILFVCSFIKLPGRLTGGIQLSVLLLLLTGSLVYGRNYYSIFYHQETEMFARHIAGYQKTYGTEKVAAVVNTEPAYLDFYKKKYKTNWTYQAFDGIGDNNAWRKWLDTCHAQYLILCNPPVEWGRQYLAMAKEYYTCVDSVYYGFTTDIYILKKDVEGCKPGIAPLFKFDINDAPGFYMKYNLPFNRGAENVCNVCDSADIRLFSSLYQAYWLNEAVALNVSIQLYTDTVKPDGKLILQFRDKENTVLQTRESTFSGFACNDTGWHTVYLTARLYHTPVTNAINKPMCFTVDLLKGHEYCVQFKNFKLEAVPDNPVLYSLIKK